MARRVNPNELIQRPPRRLDPSELVTPRVSAEPRQVTEGPGGTGQQMTEGPPATRRAQPKTFRQGAETLVGGARGAGEAALTLGSGMVAAPVGLAAGTQEAVRGGPDALQRTIEATRGAQEHLTFAPRTPQGQRILEVLSTPFEPFVGLSERAGEGTRAITGGSEGAGAAGFLGAEALQSLAGSRFRPGGRARAQAREDIGRVEGQAGELGVDLRAGVTPQAQQIQEAGRRLAPGEQGQSIPGAIEQLRAAEKRTRDARDRLYAEARANRAAIPAHLAAQEFLPALRQGIATFNLEDLPITRRMLSRAERIEALPAGSAVTLNAMEEWRKSIETRRPKQDTKRGQQENRALGIMQDELDQWLDAKFNADMVSGDPEAIAAWRNARSAQRGYAERFRDDKVIRDMVRMEAEVAEVRRWIFGANAAGMKPQANRVLTKLKNELGADSPEMAALRADAALDIVQPLFKDGGPDLRGFIAKYDNMVRSNPDAARTLFDENLTGLKELRDIAQANRNRPVAAVSELPGAARFLAVGMFGHQLAKGALRRATGEAGINVLTRVATQNVRRKMLGDILGYDAAAPFFGRRNLQALGVISTLREEAREPFAEREEGPAQRLMERTPGGP